MKYYVYDMDGCAYKSSIVITKEELKVSDEYYEDFDYSVLIGTAKTAKEANMIASKYLYDMQAYIDTHYGGYDYDEYPEFDEDEDYIEFI